MDLPLRASARRLLLLTLLAAVIGSLAGLAAYVLIHLIALLTNVALFGRVAWKLPSFRNLDPSPRLVIAPVLGGLAVGGLAKWSPIIKGHGIPEAMEAILRKQSRIAPRTAVAKPLSAAIAIGTGGPFGAEGPIIVTGGALGSLIGQVIDVSPSERKILLASGAAAGMSATFGAPLASVMLAIELLLFEFSPRAFIPLVVASSIAGGIHSTIFGSGPLFHVPQHDYAGLAQLPAYAALGLACGVMAVIICKGLFAVEHGFRRLPVAEFWHPAIGAVFFGIVGLFVPRALGVGYDAIDDALGGHLAVGILAGLMVAKLLAWWVALGSQTSGGTLAPILLISASFGGLLGRAAHGVAPGIGVSAGAFAVVAMAATFGAATRAPFTAIVFELTRDYNVVLPLMLATVLASLVAAAFLEDSLMTEKLTRRGVRVGGELHVDVLRTTLVDDVMTRDVLTISARASVEQATLVMSEGGHNAYPVVDDDGRCVALLERRDLLVGDPPANGSAVDAARRDVVAVSRATPLVDALELMVEEGLDHLPVVDDDRLVGICTRADIVRARADQIALERRQSGWLRPIVARRRPRRILLVGNRTLGHPSIAEAVAARVRTAHGGLHVNVVVPTGPHDGNGEVDRLQAQLEALRALGCTAAGEVVPARPVAAVRQVLRSEPYDEVILATLPPGVSAWLRMDAGARIERLSRLPVTHVIAAEDQPSSDGLRPDDAAAGRGAEPRETT
jgi:CIC family chloride channel protein